jgi:5S rRNA maturation endonuclease (ribonuclease M5)
MMREEIIAANPLARFLKERGCELRPAGRNFVTNACAVAQHKKHHRPVTIDTEKNLWHCNDHDSGGTVIDWLMIEESVTVAEAMRMLSGGNHGSSKIVATYDYTDEAGKLLFQCVRYQPKDFRQRQPDGKGGWIWDIQGVRRVLYRLPELLRDLKRGLPVIVTEGEKDADRLAKLGFAAAVTCNPLGAGKWRDEYGETLRSANVFVIADKDKDGRNHAQQVAVSLHAKAKRVAVLELPNRNDQNVKDASDWLATGGNVHELAELLHVAPEWTPTTESPTHADNEDGSESHDERCGQKSAATRLIDFASAFAFFHDPQDRPFVRLKVNSHTEVWPVESSKFRKLLAGLYYKRMRKAINRNSLADAITALAGRACHDSPEEPVFLRVAPRNENILIDLCDLEWRVVEVTHYGWRVREKSPVAFVRTGSMQALPKPVRRGSIAPLWQLLNVTMGQRPLVAGALLNAFHPHGPYFVLNVVGEQGTAKSCAARIVRQLVDPNENPLRSPPKEERDLLAQAASNRCVALDNLSSLPAWLSDALCRLATGGGHSARTLYTDLEGNSLAVKRPVILNGIEDVATRPDLAERVLQIELETIPEHKRIAEKDLWREFEKQRSAIFSALLDALICALRELPTITLDSLPRMADAALWATAGETAFGWQRGTFIAAYRQNLNEGAIASVEAHPIGVAIRQLLEKQNDWSGEPAQLLQALNGLVLDEPRHAKAWPENARSLGHCLRRLAAALRRVGIAVERDKGTRRIIHLCKAREKTSETSASSANCAEKDVQDVSDDLSPLLQAKPWLSVTS